MVITISNYPKVHSFFQKGTRSWCKFPVEPSLPLGSLKRPNCQGPCFPTAVPKHWGSCVFPSWTGWRFKKKLQQTDTRKQNRNRKQGCTCTISWRAQIKERLTWELLGGWDHSELNGLQVAPGLLTHLGLQGFVFFGSHEMSKVQK